MPPRRERRPENRSEQEDRENRQQVSIADQKPRADRGQAGNQERDAETARRGDEASQETERLKKSGRRNSYFRGPATAVSVPDRSERAEGADAPLTVAL